MPVRTNGALPGRRVAVRPLRVAALWTANGFFVREAQTLEKPGNRRMADGDALGSSKRIAETEERNVRLLHRRCAEDANTRGPFTAPVARSLLQRSVVQNGLALPWATVPA